jgi:hypothetical protein
MTNKELIKKHAFHNFKDEQSFEKWLRNEYQNYWCVGFKTYKKSLDCIAVKDILFTMEEYDSEGQSLVWGNKKKGINLSVDTIDRYKQGYADAKVAIYPAFGFRNDIHYIQ